MSLLSTVDISRLLYFIHDSPCNRISKVSDAYSWEDMCQLTDKDMDFLLGYYAENKVPSFSELRIAQGEPDPRKLDVFDGSFGFSIGL